MAYDWIDKTFCTLYSITVVLGLFFCLGGILTLSIAWLLLGVIFFVFSLLLLQFDKQKKIERILQNIANLKLQKEITKPVGKGKQKKRSK